PVVLTGPLVTGHTPAARHQGHTAQVLRSGQQCGEGPHPGHIGSAHRPAGHRRSVSAGRTTTPTPAWRDASPPLDHRRPVPTVLTLAPYQDRARPAPGP